MDITTASLSRSGTRTCNQDLTGESVGEHSACFVVCDGIAGLPGGELAAKLACSTILDQFDGNCHLNTQIIRQYLQRANGAILNEQQTTPDYHCMSTTLVSLFIDRDYKLACWVHVGDSRLYLFRRGWLYSVTTDHSLIQQMKDAGHRTDDINSNLLYLALGMSGADAKASYSDVVSLEDGDVFLLCTDGFWHGIGEELMTSSLQMVKTPQEWMALMNRYIQKKNCNTRFSQDNYSAVAVWMGNPEESTRLISLEGAVQLSPFRINTGS
ncbi:Serine/threonine phosphatase stp [Citrobacter freundii]|nr:Serine/threonine phosphatase stp [Citrobacter freundii]